MLKIESKIKLNKQTIESPNLTHHFDDEELTHIGQWVFEGFQRDKSSRKEWEERTAAAMDLAMQITREKNFPWADASNVAFPLVTIAVMQFHARAYPALVYGNDVVKCRVIGEDIEGNETMIAHKISTHMSWQCMEQDTSWEEQHDRLIINVACVGTAFKKTYFKHQINGDLVMAKDLVMNYYSKSVDQCPRKTHIIPLFRNDIYERVKRGHFADVLDEPWFNSSAPGMSKENYNEDNRHGVRPNQSDETTPFITLEQHVNVDLDGDGYAEPYVITIEESSQTVLRIVTRFDREEDIERNNQNEIIKINAREFFTKYPFIPSPDGGIYDVGFGVLLGPLNESCNTLVNQLIDAGTMASTAGGFLGRGAKIRGGEYSFSPLEWKRVDSTGDDLRKSIFPLPVREPSAVLFQLLNLIVDYTNRISGATDMLVGQNPGQNTPAQTSQEMVKQGQMVYSAIYKRLWRSMKDEFKKRFILNGIYLPMGRAIPFGNGSQKIWREDYLSDPDRIVPGADPTISSEGASFQKAITLKQNAMATPGYNMIEIEKDFLRAMKVDNIERIYPGPGKVPEEAKIPHNPKLVVEQMKMQGEQAKLQLEKLMFAAELQETMRMNQAKINELEAKAMKEIAEGQGVATGHEISAFNAMLGAMKHQNEVMTKKVELILKGMEIEQNEQVRNAGGNAGGGNVGGMAGASGDPSAQTGA